MGSLITAEDFRLKAEATDADVRLKAEATDAVRLKAEVANFMPTRGFRLQAEAGWQRWNSQRNA